MRTNRYVLFLAILMMTGSIGASGLVAGGASGRTADNDNDFATATALTSGAQKTGDVNFTDDASDFYKIDLRVGECMKMVLSYTCASMPIYLTAWDPGQNPVLDVLSGNTTRGDTHLAIENGTHYVEVWTQDEEQSYTLDVTVGLPAVLTPGAQVKSKLSFTGTERSEWFRIWLNGNISSKSEGVYVNMTEDSATTNFNLFAWGITGTLLNPYNLSRQASPHETVSCMASESGWYYFLANSWAGSADYTLDVTKFQGPSDGDNDLLNATKAKHNAVLPGTLDQGWDKFDWYKYHVLSGDTFQARASRSSGTDVFYLMIYSSAFDLLAQDRNVQAGAITNSITLNVQASTCVTDYYVAVFSYAAFRNSAWSDETAKETYALALTSTNHYPRALLAFDDITTDEDTPVTVAVGPHFDDPDGDQLTYNSTGQTNLAVAYNASSGKLEIAPAANWHGAETITVTADDGFGGKTPLTINLTARPINDVPFVKKKIADFKMLQGGTDTSLDLSRVFYDNDLSWGDALNYTVEKNGSLRVNIAADGKVTLVDPIEFFGPVYMQFTATDGEGASAVAQCNVTVQHVNQPPRVKSQPGNVSVDEDKTATLDLSGVFSDLDGDPITLLASGQTRITVLIDPNTLVATFKPAPNLSGFYEDIKFTAQDDKGFGEFFVIVRVAVVVVNDPPVIKSASPTGAVTLTETEGTEFSITVTTAEGWDTFNYTWFWDDKDLLWNENSYPLKTDFNSAGNHVLRVVVDDGTDSVERSWNVSVINKNRDPTDVKINSPRTGESFKQAAEVEFSGSAKDPDGDSITYSWLEGRKELSDEKTFSTTTLSPGTHNIVLEVSDGTASTRSKPITITIELNQGPRIISLLPLSGQDFAPGKKIDFSVNARDSEDDPLTYKWSEGTTVLSTQPTFSTSSLKEGTHSIQLSIHDGYSYTNQTLIVEVAAPPQSSAIGGRNLYYALAAVAGVVVVAAVAFMMMRRKKPEAIATAAPAETPAALSERYNPAPQDSQQPAPPAFDYGATQAPAGEPAPPDAGALPAETYQPPADTQTRDDQSQYSAESGISDAQPGGAVQRPAWASGPAYPKPEPPLAQEPELSQPADQPAPSEPAQAEPPADEKK